MNQINEYVPVYSEIESYIRKEVGQGFEQGFERFGSASISKRNLRNAVPSEPQKVEDSELFEFQNKRLNQWQMRHKLREIIPESKALWNCGQFPIDPDNIVTVWNETKQRAHHEGLMMCKNPSLCPICSPIKARENRQEMQVALEQVKRMKLRACMPTFTIPHGLSDSLEGSLGIISAVMRDFKNSRGYKAIKKEMGIVGDIRSLETPWSMNNGWHPHFHMILIHEHEIHIESMEVRMFELWADACAKHGITPKLDAFKLVGASDAGNYVTKSGLEYEMTGQQIKTGKKGSLTPFAMLVNYNDSPRLYKTLIREYYFAIKGKSLLKYSKGLRDLLGLEEAVKLKQEEEEKELGDSEDIKHTIKTDERAWNDIVSARNDNRFLELIESLEGTGEERLREAQLIVWRESSEIYKFTERKRRTDNVVRLNEKKKPKLQKFTPDGLWTYERSLKE